MDIEFHYYMVNIIAQRAGFSDDESYIIAYSSQYVDNNTMRFEINKGESDEFKNYISQTIDITKPKEKLMRIYPCFHFIPGDYDCESAQRKDGKLHVLNTTPNSSNANKMFDAALSTKNLYRIGICTHSYADTWAHQNFVGYLDYINGLGGVRKGIIEKLMPNIGHADAQHQPDIPGLMWNDGRLIKKNRDIHNTDRFLEAAEFIFKRFRYYLKPDGMISRTEDDWKTLKNDLIKAIGEDFKGKNLRKTERINNYQELISSFKDYDKNDWFEKAVETKVIIIFPYKYHWKRGFEDSHWYNFELAIKEHQKWANELYLDLYEQLEVKEY